MNLPFLIISSFNIKVEVKKYFFDPGLLKTFTFLKGMSFNSPFALTIEILPRSLLIKVSLDLK